MNWIVRRAKHAASQLLVRDWLRDDPCVFCYATAATVDHIVPLADGGASRWDNYAPACISCNNAKGSSSLLSFLVARANGLEVRAVPDPQSLQSRAKRRSARPELLPPAPLMASLAELVGAERA